ncbi:hypothetical protein [Maribacter polysaccharolyticus]|uniref:hypothetical protein n=1 Tax=Maribacter polysaccharolyticus TaxID=3020831 RepID=UPI00237F155F|nr:hypothetical protein [Maribacter polysaccharolyticus]MDE3742112.1 hypothetical protein [Maribacter polysaccharolyticus]
MKNYQVYRNIRKRALLFGLPVSLFALQMSALIGSLLVVIFSFSLILLMGAIVVNTSLYVILLKLTHQPYLLHFAKVFPSAISNKKTTPISYED